MNWHKLTDLQQINTIIEASNTKPQMIFKHSTRCNISSTALNRIERKWQKGSDDAIMDAWYLDLIAFREISNQIAQSFEVEHESPQILIVNNGQCNYYRSHLDIDYQEIMEQIKGN